MDFMYVLHYIVFPLIEKHSYYLSNYLFYLLTVHFIEVLFIRKFTNKIINIIFSFMIFCLIFSYISVGGRI